MKRLFLLLLTLFICENLKAQELQKIIPPSPNAAAFHVYGNTQLNYYTGSSDVTIPLFDIQEGDLFVPIYLKYTGGNGIKVEEIGSWVGLGWTLNAGGAISRTIRGIADEDESKLGFFKMTEIPIPNGSNFTIFDQIRIGGADGEADNFMYNYPSGSGSFFYNYDKSIYFKPKKDIEITHTIGVESESISLSHCLTNDKVITDFTIKDEYGKTYLFKDKERSNTITFGQPYTDNRGFPSTWYLRKMENASKTRSIDYEYDTYAYTLIRSSSTFISGNVEDDVFSETSYIGKRLKKITFSQGSVEFIASAETRKDFADNKYLEKIVVRDNNNRILKTIRFTYKYMTSSSLVASSANLTVSDTNRLILDSIEECTGDNNCENPTKFTYDTTHYLPSRFSKAKDHWGYYNGQTSNSKLEPKYFLRWYNPSVSSWIIDLVGSANRTPSVTYSTAGALKEIQYPTGGKTVFDYESHTAINDEVSGTLIPQSTMLMWQEQATSFTIQLSSKANPLSKLSVKGFYNDPINQCIPIIYVKNLATNAIYNLSLFSSGTPSTYPQEIFLEGGNYQAWFFLKTSGESFCSQDDPASIILNWNDEDNSQTKLIGGHRIKSISDYTGNNALIKRNFSYTDENSITSGRVVNIPRYYGLLYSAYNSTAPIGYRRFINSITPLTTTQGSHVGYGKISFSYENELNGKEEQYYTTSDEYPDTYNAINPSTGVANYQIFQGVKIYPFPPPEEDSKDFLRGMLKKQINYKKDGNTFVKVYEKLYSYDSLKYSIEDMHSIDDYIKNAAKTVRGLKVSGDDDYTYYDIYTGYNLPSKTITKQYSNSGVLVQTAIQKYDEDVYGLAKHYIPIISEITNSDGILRQSNTTFIFNKVNFSVAENLLKNNNALYIPLQVETYKDIDKDGVAEPNELLSRHATKYKDWGNSIILPETIQTSKGDNTLKNSIIYHSYDNKDNPLEVSKADGTHIIYIWGYNQTQPIAKIENATYIEIQSALAVSPYFTSVEAIQNVSDTDVDAATEAILRTTLASIRNALPNSQVTTYTYDPLIGVTSITDPRGETIYYHYDGFNRLEYVKDEDGNILSENQYHYKNQQ